MGFKIDPDQLLMKRPIVYIHFLMAVSCLLGRAQATGEMRSHQACVAHVEGNNSHVVESMVYFGIVNGEKDGTAVSVVE